VDFLEPGERVLDSDRVRTMVDHRVPLGWVRRRSVTARLTLTELRVVLSRVDAPTLLGMFRGHTRRTITHEIRRGRLGTVEVSAQRDQLRVQSSDEGYAMTWFEVATAQAQWWADRLTDWNRSAPGPAPLPTATLLKR
jgi:hypothetical protein